MKKLLVVVDYQNDFVDGALGFAGAEKLEPGILKRVEDTLAEGNFVLFTRDTHDAQYLSTREGRFLPVPHCEKGGHGHQLYGALHSYEAAPRPGTLILDKTTFGSPDIAARATELCGGAPEQIELCGLVTDICVVSNAILLHSALPLAHISVLAPLCGSGNGEGAGHALALMAGLGIEVRE